MKRRVRTAAQLEIRDPGWTDPEAAAELSLRDAGSFAPGV
jgi:hypothetical protein